MNDHLRNHVKVRDVSRDRYWNSLNLHNWTRCYTSGLKQHVPKGNPGLGLRKSKKSKPFNEEIQIADKCTFFEGWLQNFEELAAEGDIQM
jgi:hypothetical protein